MNRRSLIPTLAALTALMGMAVAGVLAQQPAPGRARTVYETRPDGTLVERPVAGKVVATMQRGPLGTTLQYDDGRSVTYLPGPLDAEGQKLLGEEQAAAQEARNLAQQAQQGESETAKADAKKKLREKLVAIFDLQQQRRDGEIKKIEDRLAKLKETLKKRDAAKDSIVDRRLETLTGGVDELGWEDTFGNVPNPYGRVNWSTVPAPPLPSPVPGPAAEPRYGLPPTAPRAGAAPAFPVPAPPPAIPQALPPATAPVPPAAPVAPAPPVDPVPAVAPAATR
jgi:hypothetical protein